MIVVEPEVDKLIKAIEYDLGKELSPLLEDFIYKEINPLVSDGKNTRGRSFGDSVAERFMSK